MEAKAPARDPTMVGKGILDQRDARLLTTNCSLVGRAARQHLPQQLRQRGPDRATLIIIAVDQLPRFARSQ